MYVEKNIFSEEAEKYQNAQCEPRNQPTQSRIDDSLEHLVMQINELEGLMRKLDCLIPPFESEVKTPQVNKEFDVPICALAMGIYGYADRLRNICRKLEAVQL